MGDTTKTFNKLFKRKSRWSYSSGVLEWQPWVVFVSVVLAAVVVIGLIAGIIIAVTAKGCEDTARLYDLDHVYTPFIGCKVQVVTETGNLIWLDMSAIEPEGNSLRVFVVPEGNR